MNSGTAHSANPVWTVTHSAHAVRTVPRAAVYPIPVQQAQFQSEEQGMEQLQEQQLPCLAQRSLEASAE